MERSDRTGPSGPGNRDWAWGRLEDAHRVKKLLGYNRIDYAWELPESAVRFVVHVCDQVPRAAYARLPAQGGYRWVPQGGKAARQVIQMAMRAVHVVGLDAAKVSLAVRDGHVAVRRLEPYPGTHGDVSTGAYGDGPTGPCGDDPARAIPHDRSPLTLGADPEFVLVANGELLPASRFFPLTGQVGCDAFVNRDTGEHPLAELRPPPAAEPGELVANIGTALAGAHARLPWRSIRWLAGSMPVPGLGTGGHIHLGTAPSAGLVRALDSYLAVPLFLIEDPHRARERRTRYGFLGEIRLQPHGFEYRTPSSWLWSPDVTRGVIALARIIAGHHDQLAQDVFAQDEAHAAFYAGRREYFLPLLDPLWRDLVQAEGHSRDMTCARLLFDMARDGPASEDVDLIRAWGIASARRAAANPARNLAVGPAVLPPAAAQF